jgi:hypothetical protein
VAIAYNPGIVTSDLGLCLDVFNSESFTGSTTTWFDISGNNLHATGSSGLSATGLASGGSAWSTPSTSLLNTDTHSVFFTVRFNTNGTYPNGTSGNWDMLFQYAAGGSDRTPGVWRYPSNRYIHWRYDPGNSGADFGQTSLGSGGTEFAVNTWFYIGVTKNGATATSYVNGTSLGTSTVSSPKTRGNAAITLFPYYAAPAQIGCVQVYNNVLTAAQVEQNFNAIRRNYGI